MAEGEINKYALKGDQSDSLPAPRPCEAQPMENIPTSVLNSQPGQQDMLCYEQQYSGDRKSLIPHAQPLSGYAPHTQLSLGYAPHTQPPPGYAPQTRPLREYVQPAYSAQPPANGYVTGQQVIVQAPQPLPAVSLFILSSNYTFLVEVFLSFYFYITIYI